MKIFYLVLLGVVLGSCGPRKEGKAITSVSFSLASKEVVRNLSHGAFIYAINADPPQTGKLKRMAFRVPASFDSALTMELPNGPWKFYGLGFHGSDLASPLLMANKCAYGSEPGGTNRILKLDGTPKSVSMEFTLENCGFNNNQSPFSTADSSGEASFNPLKIFHCSPEAFTGITSGSGTCSSISTDIVSFKLVLMPYHLMGDGAITLMEDKGMASDCLNTALGVAGGSAVNLRVPVGNPEIEGDLPFAMRLLKFKGKDCAGTPLHNFFSHKGLRGLRENYAKHIKVFPYEANLVNETRIYISSAE